MCAICSRLFTGQGSPSMCGLPLNRMLTGTALAVALTMASGAAVGQTDKPPVLDARAIEALIPMPEPANMPPPSIADVGGPATGTIAPKPAEPQTEPSSAARTVAPVEPPPATVKDTTSPSLAEADKPIAEKLQDLVKSRLDRLFVRKNERSAVETFYRDRGYAPLWIENGAASARASAAIAYL